MGTPVWTHPSSQPGSSYRRCRPRQGPTAGPDVRLLTGLPGHSEVTGLRRDICSFITEPDHVSPRPSVPWAPWHRARLYLPAQRVAMKITILADLYADGGHDPAVDQVAEALRQGRHKVSRLLVPDDLKAVTAGLARRKPELVFHLIHDFGGESGLIATAAVIDALRLPYTGGGPGELFIRGNKGLAKKILAYEKLNCPDFAVFSRDATMETGGNLRMPLIVKPLERDGSIGIGANALVRSVPEMMERVAAIHKDVKDAALVEEYIEGREFFVGVLGNREPVAFPPIEMDFSGLPEGAPKVLGYEAKWEKGTAEFEGT